MTDGREQDRLRDALHEAGEPRERGIDLDAVLRRSRGRRRPRVAVAGGALAVVLVAGGIGLAGGLLPQLGGMTGASDTSELADAPVETFSDPQSGGGSVAESESSTGEPTTDQQEVAGADVCALPEAALAEERGIALTTPAELDRDGTTSVAIGGVDSALTGEVLVESIALLEGDRVVAVLLGADGATPIEVEAGESALVDVQGALIGCGDGPPASGGYEAVATVQLFGESGAPRTLRSSPAPLELR